ISYKCGAGASCDNSNTFAARGTAAGNAVHLRASTFGTGCTNPTPDTNCRQDCCTPVISCPGDVTLDCSADTEPGGAAGTAMVTNGCNATLSHGDETFTGSCAGSYTIVRTWVATGTDSCHNTASCTQRITVTDTHGPTIHCPAGTTVDCAAPTDPSATGEATAEDDCSGVASITPSDSITPGNCAGRYTITRTWTATDGCGNSSSCDQTITVTDTTGPTIHCPADTTVDCAAPNDPSATGEATAEDDCSGVASITP